MLEPMAQVNFSAGIDSVSGALSKPSKSGQHSCTKMLLATHRVAPSSSDKCNRLYLRRPVKRTTQPSALEIEKRTMFATASRNARLRMKNLSTIADDKAAFQAQSQYKTLYQYIFNSEYDKLRG